jgi:transcriptional regulator with XRE-family HTH domain
MITKEQCRAARAFLDWSQGDLAERSGISLPSISGFERGLTRPETETLRKIQSCLELNGVVFIKDYGITLPQTHVVHLEGEDWLAQLFDDIDQTLNQGDELLVDMADDRVATDYVIEKYKTLRKKGIIMRRTIEENNLYMIGATHEYRWIPSGQFKNWVTLIYKDKVAYRMSGSTRCTIIKDPNRAEIERNKYNLIWNLLPEITAESTAPIRF